MKTSIYLIILSSLLTLAAAYGGWELETVLGENLNDVAMISTTDGWAVGDGGRIYRYNGSSWRAVTSPTTNDLNEIKMLSPTSGWAVGHHGTTIRYNGSSWVNVATPTDNHLYAADFRDMANGFAGGRNGVLLYYSSGSWKQLNSPTTRHIQGIDVLGAYIWLAGNAGEIWLVGGAWPLKYPSGTGNDLYDIEFYDMSLGFAVGAYETVCAYNGTRWTRVHQGPVVLGLMAVDIVSPTDVWAVGGQGIALHYTGSVWTYAQTPVTVTLNGVSFVDAQNGWAVGDGGFIIRYRTGTGVSPASLGRVKALFN